MPIHDWTRVNAATFHSFHTVWIGELTKALNRRVLPRDYYAQAEQVATRRQTDVLTLHRGLPTTASQAGVAVAEAAPQVRLRSRPSPAAARRPSPRRRRRVTVRHVSDHRVVAVIEIVSPANKDREANVRGIAGKIIDLLQADIQVMVIDLLPPGRHDPQGIHGAVWCYFDPAGYTPPPEEPLTLASYRWDNNEPEVFVEPVRVGRTLIDMPLFLNGQRYVLVPLEPTYQEAFEGQPLIWQEVLQGAATSPPDERPG